jgi:DNA-binding transcriptional LysR family regulator
MGRQKISGSLANVEVFCRALETGSFTTAATMFGMTPQAVSRSVARLEESLGVTLFRRTTRHIEATEEGRTYYLSCQQALKILGEGERTLSLRRKTPSGVVRISVPTTYAHHRLLPSLGTFRRMAPEIQLDINVSNRNIDFVREGYELAIRMGDTSDTSLIARTLGDFSLGVFASPIYLARKSAPRDPSALVGHDCIVFTRPSTGRVLPWNFSPSLRSWTPPSTCNVSDDALATIALACAGVGVVQTYHFLVEDLVARGELVEILTNYRGDSRRFSLLYPRDVVLSRAARTLADFIVEQSRRDRTTKSAITKP